MLLHVRDEYGQQADVSSNPDVPPANETAEYIIESLLENGRLRLGTTSSEGKKHQIRKVVP
jgi:hypothetical protein